MERLIDRKINVLEELGILCRCSDAEMERLVNAANDVQLDNTARTLIMKYL